MKRLHLDTKEHLELVHDLLLGGFDWRDAPERSIGFHEEVRFNLERRIRLHEEWIKTRCLERIIAEWLNLSEAELRVLLEQRTNEWIEDRTKKEATKAIQLWNHSDDRLNFDENGYLIKKDEPEELEPYIPTIYRINKNGLDVTIELWMSTYKSVKDGNIYKINSHTNAWSKKFRSYREIIIRECAEAGLHVDWILKILSLSKDYRRRVAYVARKFGFEVCQTPRSQLKTAETIRILDEDGMFLVEKPNLFKIKKTEKSFDGMGEK